MSLCVCFFKDVSNETIYFLIIFLYKMAIFCTIILEVCNFVVPLRPETIKKDLDEKKIMDWHCDANRFNPNFRG